MTFTVRRLGAGDERVLVVYHNKYAATRGWILTSVGYLGKTGKAAERMFMRKKNCTTP